MFKKEKSADLKKALDRATYYLSRRDHSEKELREKLGRAFTPEAVSVTLESCKRQNWLKAPESLAQQWTRLLLDKGKGPLYINAYLKKRGLPSQAFDDDDLTARALATLESKYPQWEELSFQDRQKPIRFLLQRGFPQRIVLKLLAT